MAATLHCGLTGARMGLIAETVFDLSDTNEKVGVRLFAPAQDEHGTWFCEFEIDHPIAVARRIHGESSLQALTLAMKTLSAYLYGSEAYRAGQLGIYGEYGRYLTIPAPHEFLDVAPYPF